MEAGSSRRAASSISLTPDDTWTNQSFTTSVCGAYTTSITSLYITPKTTSTKWFRIPSCVSTWSTLKTVSCSNCQMPAFNVLPSSITFLSISNTKGSWTQTEAGTVSDTSTADYFDWSWLPNLPNLSNLFFTSVPLSGTLPNQYSHAKLTYWYFAAVGPMVGTISPLWFQNYPMLTTMWHSGSKYLTGTIPYSNLQNLDTLMLSDNAFTHWPTFDASFPTPTAMTNLDVSSNNLVEIPSEANFQAMTGLGIFNVQNNLNLAVNFPNLFARAGSVLLTSVYASNCSFTGSLPPVPSSYAGWYLNFQFAHNQFSGTIPSSWSPCTFSTLALEGNSGLGGALATADSSGNIISQFITSADLLSLDGPGFSGPMFNISQMTTISILSINTPNVDFCGAARQGSAAESQTLLFPSSTLQTCDLRNTNARYCSWAYPSKCVSTPLPPPQAAPVPVSVPQTVPQTTEVVQPIPEPVSQVEDHPVESSPPVTMSQPVVEVEPPTPVTAPGDPQPVAASVPVPVSGCPLPSPGTAFACQGQDWVSLDSVDQEELNLPTSSSTIVIGNLTASRIRISSLSTAINVTGCITSSTGDSPSITVSLTESDLKKIDENGGSLTRQLISQSSSCAPVSYISVDTSTIKSCKKVKTDQVATSGIAATFTLDSSKCRVWWIVVVSVVCGVVLVAVVIVVLLVAFSKRVRYTILPFSKPRTAQSAHRTGDL